MRASLLKNPFGRDLASARELNHVAHSVFPENSIFCIDYFLGKEAIMNILYFRFAIPQSSNLARLGSTIGIRG
jgi:glucose-6-phosphate 1-dehydrogenase